MANPSQRNPNAPQQNPNKPGGGQQGGNNPWDNPNKGPSKPGQSQQDPLRK